jgi:hypothetical protein
VTDQDLKSRSELFLPFLCELSTTVSSWAAWKNVDLALNGSGDIDAIAEQSDWSFIARSFRLWASDAKLRPLHPCLHLPGSMILAAVDGSGHVLELHLSRSVSFRGSEIVSASDLLTVCTVDDRGFRRLCVGAEGLLVFVLNGVLLGGRANPTSAKGQRAILLASQDPDGAKACGRLLGRKGANALAGLHAAQAGTWNRPALLFFEAQAAAGTLLAPIWAVRRGWFRLAARRRCPLIAITSTSRVVDADVEGWADAVDRYHEMASV